MSDARIKIGNIIKFRKDIKIFACEAMRKLLYEVVDIEKINCGGCQKRCYNENAQSRIWLSRDSRSEVWRACSFQLTQATDREVFLYHVIGLRERLE